MVDTGKRSEAISSALTILNISQPGNPKSEETGFTDPVRYIEKGER